MADWLDAEGDLPYDEVILADRFEPTDDEREEE